MSRKNIINSCICKQCNKIFIYHGNRYRKFCSNDCFALFRKLNNIGFIKGHSFYKGSEKGWFKKGIIPKTAFKKGHKPWNKDKRGIYSEISLKKMSESSKGKHFSQSTEFKKGNCKEKSGNWKGGVTSLHKCIKGLEEYNNWRTEVFKRDCYTCQDCGQKGKRLHCHHIISFAKLLNKFLNKYKQFSSIEDKETLVRLAITYEPFWEISNGQTLCKDCHKLTESYLRG